MDEKMKELVAIGASAAVNCHPCMQHHLAECDRLGIDHAEVRVAVEVGMMVNRGAAAKTRDVADALLSGAKPAKESKVGCGCGA